MKLGLKASWYMEDPNDKLKKNLRDEFQNIRDWWNRHNEGSLTWDNVFSYLFKGPTLGTTTNDNAQAGNIGEYVSGTVAQANAINTAATDTYGDITNISLTAGDWDVTGIPTFTPNGFTGTRFRGGISTTAGNSSSGMSLGDSLIEAVADSGSFDQSIIVPVVRMSLSTTTTVYMKALATFSAGQPKMYGRISARRIR